MEQAQAKDDTGRLIELLEEQRTLFRQLRRLADRQQALIQADDVKPLLGLLADRQRLVDGLLGVNEQLAAYRKNWSAVYSGLDEGLRRRIAGLLEEANASFGTILQCDSRDSAALSAKRQEVGGRLMAVGNGSRARAAYAAASGGTGLTNAEA